MSETHKQLGFREVLGIFEVRRIWLAQIVSLFGDFLAIFAVLSQVSFQFHASATEVTGISVSFLLPFAVIGPIVGVFADRWNVKRSMIISDLTRALLATLLLFASGVWWIYGTLFALSIVSTFFVPAQSIAIRSVTPPEGLLTANALMQQAMQIVRIVTPALAGALVILGLFRAVVYPLQAVMLVGGAALIWKHILDPLSLYLFAGEAKANILFFPSTTVAVAALILLAFKSEDRLSLDRKLVRK